MGEKVMLFHNDHLLIQAGRLYASTQYVTKETLLCYTVLQSPITSVRPCVQVQATAVPLPEPLPP